MMFGIGIIVFHFCIALSCPDSDFNFLDMFQVLRKSSIMGRQTGPYLLRSQLGAFLQRPCRLREPIDGETLTAIRQLDTLEYPDGTSEETSLVCRETQELLKAWILKVDAGPQVWQDYIHFPMTVS